MVGVLHIGQNVDGFDLIHKAFRDDMVVDAPTQVLPTGIGTVAPPAVAVGFLHQVAETVDIAIAKEFSEPFTLLRQET